MSRYRITAEGEWGITPVPGMIVWVEGESVRNTITSVTPLLTAEEALREIGRLIDATTYPDLRVRAILDGYHASQKGTE